MGQGDVSFVSGLGCGESWLKEAPFPDRTVVVSGDRRSRPGRRIFFGLETTGRVWGVDPLEGFVAFFWEGQRKKEEI